jgi:hypothetical protein
MVLHEKTKLEEVCFYIEKIINTNEIINVFNYKHNSKNIILKFYDNPKIYNIINLINQLIKIHTYKKKDGLIVIICNKENLIYFTNFIIEKNVFITHQTNNLNKNLENKNIELIISCNKKICDYNIFRKINYSNSIIISDEFSMIYFFDYNFVLNQNQVLVNILYNKMEYKLNHEIVINENNQNELYKYECIINIYKNNKIYNEIKNNDIESIKNKLHSK